MINNTFILDVSIIIVSFNTKQLLSDCLNSIYKKTNDISFEVIVSDNGSSDGSIEMLKEKFPQVILIENNANIGFGAANNRGFKIAKGKYIFYLNSDTILLNNAVKVFFDYWEKHENTENIGALGCNLLDVNENITSSYGCFPNINKYISDLIHTNYGLWKQFIKKIIGLNTHSFKQNINIFTKKIGSVDYIVGASLFLKNDNFAKFDENFFLYYEETDLQYQLKKANKERLLIDGPMIVHLEGCSSKLYNQIYTKEFINFSSRCLKLSSIYYFKKNNSKIKSLIIKLLILLLWCNPQIIKYNYKCVPILFKKSITPKDIELLKNPKR